MSGIGKGLGSPNCSSHPVSHVSFCFVSGMFFLACYCYHVIVSCKALGKGLGSPNCSLHPVSLVSFCFVTVM